MKKLLMGLAVLPFAAGVAVAAQPLTPQQMDRVTGGLGFGAFAQASAEGLVGPGGILTTTTATLAEVTPYATVGTVTVYEWQSPAQFSSNATPIK